MTGTEWIKDQIADEKEANETVSPEVARYLASIKVEASHIQLQGIGWYPAVTGAELEIGDTLVWNYGETSEILDMQISKSGKTAQLTTRSNSTNKEYTRRITMTAKYARKVNINTPEDMLAKAKLRGHKF